MKNEVKLGLQVHSVREAFAEDPRTTLQRIKAMGYTGVEFPMGSITSANEGLTTQSANFYRELLAETGLECYGILTSWEAVQPDRLEATLRYNEDLGSPFLVIGSVPTKLVPTMKEVEATVAYMKEAQKIINAQGIVTGYHNHDSDFFHVIGGKTYFEHIFDNTPQDFVMLLDTGNAQAGGFDSVKLLEKYPHRSPFLHVKGHSGEKGYLAWIGQDDIDWPHLINVAQTVGDSVVFDVEFGMRADYDPFERAQAGYDVLSKILLK